MSSAHGTWARYTNDDCRCPDCAAACTRYGQHRRLGRTPPRTAAAPAVARLRVLRAHGFTFFQLRVLAGVDCQALLTRNRRTIRVTTADRIMSIEIPRAKRAIR